MYNAVRAAWIRRQSPETVWERNLPAEVAFWRDQLPTRVTTRVDYQVRADAQGEVTDPAIIYCLDSIPDETVSIIDVGSGPLTAVGTTYSGKRLQVTAVDPLADEYVRDMEKAGIDAPVVPTAGCGENLLTIFDPKTFDIVYARNSLDHGFDPMLAIENMLELVKPGRFMVLRHQRCEARRRSYAKLHQWNFDMQGEDLILWRQRRDTVNVSEMLRDRARVECGMSDGWLLAIAVKDARDAAGEV